MIKKTFWINQGGFKEAHSGEVMIKADPDVFSDILDFIYSQKLQINEDLTVLFKSLQLNIK